MKKIVALLLAATMVFVLGACGKGDKPEDTTPPDEATTPSQPEPAPEPETKPDPLTGLGIPVDTEIKRPYAVMINNFRKALPHAGIEKAGVIYEVPAEGGITRLMAIFNDYSPEKIGPVRSSRHYYLDYAFSYDAVYVHAGASPQAYEYIKKSGAASMDGLYLDIFYRDQARKKAGYSLEHTLFTTGEGIGKVMEKKKYRLVPDDENAFFLFSESPYTPTGEAATKVSVNYPSKYTPTFAYDAEKMVYLRNEFGDKHIDETTGNQLAFTNVLVVNTNISQIKGDTYGRLNVNTTGSGKGKYISMGKAEDITWKKTAAKENIRFYKADGTELAINPGKTFVQVMNTTNGVTFSEE